MNDIKRINHVIGRLIKAAGLFIISLPLFCFAQPDNAKDVAYPVNNIIPKPVSVDVLRDKPVSIMRETVIIADKKFSDQVGYLQQQLAGQCGLQLSMQTKSPVKGSTIILEYNSRTVSRPEMYLLDIKNNQVKIQARDTEGLVHGIQTLMQLLPLKSTEKVELPAVSIIDYPRFRYRGMHLDVSRHFFPVSYIKKYIDYLAFHKFNTFHWHLTDDQGWRVEIKSYPRLTEVGAWRDSTLIGHFRNTPHRYDGKPYGGYYTQEEVKDIVRFAAVRGITIIPEIDIPGHSRAAIASYPELSTSPDTAWKVAVRWGTFNRENNVLAPNKETFAFLKAVFGEVAALFPSPYIHVGGDECSKRWWKADPETQAFMKEQGLQDETALQTYFIQQVAGYLKAKGKKVIGWDEILEPGLDTSAVIMNWRKVTSAISAAEKGHNVIMAQDRYLYFNYYQSKSRDTLAIGGNLPLDTVYAYEPVPASIAAQGLGGQVLGAQGNVWTEYIKHPSTLEYMLFPRLTALSEVLWADRSRMNIEDFKRRLKLTAIPRFKFWGTNYYE